jgi:pantoate--beta-alanine ligase
MERTMRIIHSLDEMTETARGWLAGGPVGFIPTSGNLHAGQLSLIQTSQRECEITVVSIFTGREEHATPYQGAGMMYDLTRDVQFLESAQADIVFIPRPQDIYPPAFATYVIASGPVVEHLECELTRDHARYVATTFTRLLQLVRPDIAYFGQKSAQLVVLVHSLVHDLCIDTSLRVLPMVREGDGLALSSRNTLLTSVQRQEASLLYRALLRAKTLIEQGERTASVLQKTMAEIISASPQLRLDYTAVCDASTFAIIEHLPATATTQAGFLLAVAAYAGSVRLTDNIQFTRNGYWLM